jgi:hypothetical protein
MRRKGRDVSIAQEYRGPKSQVSKKEMANREEGKDRPPRLRPVVHDSCAWD